MKFYGDYFEMHYCLPDEEWNAISASSASFSTPLTVNGLFNTTANGIDGIFNGGNRYQHAGRQILFCFVSHKVFLNEETVFKYFAFACTVITFFRLDMPQSIYK